MKKLGLVIGFALVFTGCSQKPTVIWEGDVFGPTRFTLYPKNAEVRFSDQVIKFHYTIADNTLFLMPENENDRVIEIGKIEKDGSLSLMWIPSTIDDSGRWPYKLKRIPNQTPEPTR